MLERNRARLSQPPEYSLPEAPAQATPTQIVGGNQPAIPSTPPRIVGGNQQYEGSVRVPPMSNPLPVDMTTNARPRVMGGNLPADGDTTWTQPPAPPAERPQPIDQQRTPAGGFSPVNVVQDTMAQLMDPNGAYLRNARQRGIEAAAAGGNRAGGSIAAGSSMRAAIEAAQPMLAQAMALQGQREGFAFQGEQNALERNRDYTQAQLQDWMNARSFNRDFYGALTMMPINSAYQLNSMIQSYALENPDVYTAEVISGMSNFFTQNFGQILATYFPGIYGGTRPPNNAGGGG